MPKRVTSGGVHFHGLGPGQLSSEETSLQWQATGDAMYDLTVSGIEPFTFRTDSNVLNHYTNRLYSAWQYFYFGIFAFWGEVITKPWNY